MIPGSYESDKPINNTGIDEIHLKADCINRSIVKVIREPILYSCALDKLPGQKIYKEPRTNLLKETNKPVLSHIRFYIEDDDHKPVDFNNEIRSFTGQLIKK